MKRIFASIFSLILLVTVVGCSAAAPAPTARGVAPSAPAAGAPVAPQSLDKATGGANVANQPDVPNAAGAERMIVYTGQLELIVKDAAAAVDQITQIVKDSGGFVTASNTFKDSGHTRATMSIRVPGEDLAQLKATLAKIEGVALQVESRKLDGQDVTDQFSDNQAQLDNLTAARDQYRNLLDRATKMDDILSIQGRLDQIQGQINQLTGRQLKLKESVKLATVTITLTPDELAQPIQLAGWRPEGTARDAFRALLNALKALGDILIWSAICILPIGLLIGLPLFLVARFVIGRRRLRKATPPPAQP